jgi:DNA-binding transcriptional MerR regulator
MPRRKWLDELFGSLPAYDVPKFSTGEAAEVLKMPIWRIQKFLDVESYPLSPTTQLGRGKGKRRMFRTEDLYRIAIAGFLLKDGFTPKVVSAVLEQIEDKEFVEYDELGDSTLGVYFVRDPSTGQRVIRFFRPNRASPPKNAHYWLDFGIPISEVRQSIREAMKKHRSRS